MTEYAGFDVSKEETAYCIKDGCDRILAQVKTAADPPAWTPRFIVITAPNGRV